MRRAAPKRFIRRATRTARQSSERRRGGRVIGTRGRSDTDADGQFEAVLFGRSGWGSWGGGGAADR